MLSSRCHRLLAGRAWGTSVYADSFASSSTLHVSTTHSNSPSHPVTGIDTWVRAASGSSPLTSWFPTSTACAGITTSQSHVASHHQAQSPFSHNRSLSMSSHAAASRPNPSTWTTLADSDSPLPTSHTTSDPNSVKQQPELHNTQPSSYSSDPNSPVHAHSPSSSMQRSSQSQSYWPSHSSQDPADEESSSTVYVPDDDAEDLQPPTAPASSFHTIPSTYYRLPPEAPTQGTFPQSVAQRKFNHRVNTMLGVVLSSDSVLKERLVEKFGFTVHQVRVSKDRKVATVLWDSYPESVEACGKELNLHTGRLRSALASALNTRFSPTLTFRHDHLPFHQGKLAETFEHVSTLMALEALSAKHEEEHPEPESSLSIGAALLQAGMVTKTWREREYDGRKARGRTEDWGKGESDEEGEGGVKGKKAGTKYERPVRVYR